MGTLAEGPGRVGVRRESSRDDDESLLGRAFWFKDSPRMLDFGSEPDWSMMVPCAATLVIDAVAPVKSLALGPWRSGYRSCPYPLWECERPIAGAASAAGEAEASGRFSDCRL